METKISPSNANSKRWFSTGFMAGGITGVDASKHCLLGGVLIRPGEAKGHGVWVDKEMCRAVADMTANGKSATAGLKARFGHPNMCGDALGTFLGRWKNPRFDEATGFVRADLFISSTAAESPNGDLRKYVEDLAAKEPDHFGSSIVFTRDTAAEEKFYNEHCIEQEVRDDQGNVVSTMRRFQSPDPANVQNLPHARCAELHAADLVDDPAATDGMFSGAGGAALAAQVTEWLDLHPQVFDALREPGVVDMLRRHSDKLEPFLAKYEAAVGPAADCTCPSCGERFVYGDQPETSAGSVACPKCGASCTQANCDVEDSPAAEPADCTDKPAEPGAEGDKAMSARLVELDQQIAQLGGERAAAVQRAEQAEASHKTLSAERDQLAAQVKQIESEKAAMAAELSEAKQKLAVLTSGQPPASITSAEQKQRGSMWDDARRQK